MDVVCEQGRVEFVFPEDLLVGDKAKVVREGCGTIHVICDDIKQKQHVDAVAGIIPQPVALLHATIS